MDSIISKIISAYNSFESDPIGFDPIGSVNSFMPIHNAVVSGDFVVVWFCAIQAQKRTTEKASD